MKIFFSVGEPSGDLHGANLVRDLKTLAPNVQCVGYGGPKMAAAGCDIQEDLTALAIMGFAPVLRHLYRFWTLISRANRYFREHRPDAVVLIDYPGFNWWIARCAKRHGVPVFYYGPPQMWAWAAWRIHKMRRLVDHVLCKLPFEATWYAKRGCKATYVGHPYFDEMERQQLDAAFLLSQRAESGRLVTILPGSRTLEVVKNLPTFLRAAKLILESTPDARLAIASFNEKQATLAREMAESSGVRAEVFVGRTPELIHLAECCLACSGSVSLELMHHAKPAVILYVVGRLGFLVQPFFRKVKYITLVNLLAADELHPRDLSFYHPSQPGAEQVPFPEYPTYEDRAPQLAAHVVEWLTNETLRQQKVEQLTKLRNRFGQSGASQRAAEYIVSRLGKMSAKHLNRAA